MGKNRERMERLITRQKELQADLGALADAIDELCGSAANPMPIFMPSLSEEQTD